MRTGRKNNKCDKCDAEAAFDSPEQLCDLHWATWWTDGLMDGKDITGGYTREQLLKETLDIVQNGYNPDEDAEEEK